MILYICICLFFLTLSFNKVVVTLSVLKELKKQTIEVKEIVDNHEIEKAYVNDEPQTTDEYLDSFFDLSENDVLR